MRVATVGTAFHSFFKHHFDTCDVITKPAEILGGKYHLVIFTGGADVNPKRYGQPPLGASMWNDERDKMEFNIMSHIRSLPGIKVLGVCRGHQLLNVAFGGNLIQDLHQEGITHRGPRHKLEWTIESPLAEIFPVTNSIHHQAIHRIGRSSRVGRGIVLAKEKESRVIESVLWGNRFLGVQFHPEMMAESTQFFNLIKNWVKGSSIAKIPDDQSLSLGDRIISSVDWELSDESHSPPEEVEEGLLESRILAEPSRSRNLRGNPPDREEFIASTGRTARFITSTNSATDPTTVFSTFDAFQRDLDDEDVENEED